MNAGISVSRVGGAAQIKVMRKVAGGLRLDLADFRELEAFSQMGTDVDPATQARLDRGRRMVEILKQGQYEPMHVIDQVLVIYAGTRGHLDKIPTKEVPAWEKQFLTFIHHQKPEILDELDKKKDLSDDLIRTIEGAIKEFQAQYASGESAKKKGEAPKRQPVAV
jgi:F-type H+-transporting ATPase subunit alpha